jgi:FdhD protein
MLPEETPVALTYDGSSHAVMMATPADLEDFAIGFSLTEGLVETPEQIKTLDVVPGEQGIELRMFLAPSQGETLGRHRRYRAGPTGCGLCGIESLAEALPPLRSVNSSLRITAASICTALKDLETHQQLNRQAHAVHAAAFCNPDLGLILREDIGRHNAVDKLAGALARAGILGASGFVVISSRVSIDMVQKAAVIGTPVIVALSAPSALAVRACESAGLTLIAIAREDAFEVYAHPERLVGDPAWRRLEPRCPKPSEPPKLRDAPA